MKVRHPKDCPCRKVVTKARVGAKVGLMRRYHSTDKRQLVLPLVEVAK